MRIPSSLKINEENSKIILRQAAEAEGLPNTIAWRKKRAAQYGSRLDRAIDKLARKNGFSLKKEYLASLL
jgi:diphthine-ammonia ligase